MIASLERRLGSYWEVGWDRVRAAILRLRGANLGAKTRVGANCVVRRPWCFETGYGVEIEHSVFIKATGDSARIRLGSGVFVGAGSEFDISEGLSVGDGVLIAPGCFITDHNHLHARGAPIASQGCSVLPVRIGDDVWLGANVVILPGVTVGAGAVIAAGAVVTKDVQSMTIVAGVPAKRIGSRT